MKQRIEKRIYLYYTNYIINLYLLGLIIAILLTKSIYYFSIFAKVILVNSIILKAETILL